MISRIICPTDFTSIANNAVEYAAGLCKALDAGLLLLHVEQVPANVPLLASGVILDENMSDSMSQLRSLSRDVAENFKIPCSYHVSVARQNIASAIAEQTGEHNLIVMGTNGVDDLYTYFFGSNAYHVARKVKCPALVIPADASYEGIKKMTLAIEYDFKTSTLLDPLKEFIRVFNPELDVVHVSENSFQLEGHRSETGPDLFSSQEAAFREVLGKEGKLEFKQLYSDDFAGAISEFVVESGADLLAITIHTKGIFSSFMGHSVAKELTGTANYPILVFPV